MTFWTFLGVGGHETIQIPSDLDESKLGDRAGRPEFNFEGPGSRNGG